MKAYPYDVEIRVVNENTKETRLETRRVYAYNAMDAGCQAIFEAGATAGSGDIRVVRISPPVEWCITSPLEELSRAIARSKEGMGAAMGKVADNTK